MRDSVRGVIAVLLIGSLPIPFAHAQEIDPTAIADDIVAAVTDGTRTAAYETATLDGTTVTITGFTMSDEPNQAEGAVAEIVVIDPVFLDEGGFIADSMQLIDGTLSDGANILVWDLVEIADFVIPPVADLAAETGPIVPLTAFSVAGLIFDAPQANDLIIEGVTLELGEVLEGVPYQIAMTITGIEVPMDLADNSEPFAILSEMGFATLVMDFNIEGTFEAETDTLFADSIGINIHDFGHLDVSGIFTGLPLGMLQAPGGIEEVLASAMVEEVRIRFENGGAMDAFFGVQAELTGVNPEDVAVGLAFVFQAYLQTLENPELEQQVGQAVGRFLRDPRILTIIADPAESVPLMEIVGLIVSAPTALPGLLDLVVTANDAPVPE